MRAAWYEKQGPAREVLKMGEMADPTPGPGEVRIRMVASGINPGDVKKRQNAFGYGMPYTRVIPHSDGAGRVDLAHSRTGPSARLPSTPSYPSIRLFRCRRGSPSSREPVSEFPVSRHTVVCMRRVRLRGAMYWCKAGPVQLAFAPCSSPAALVRPSLQPWGHPPTHPLQRRPVRIMLCTAVPI
jgi:threonine dehydrogenase-like Zn-dependent dehydrogenase